MTLTAPNPQRLQLTHGLLRLLARNRGGVRYSIDKGAYIWNSNGRQVSDAQIQKKLDGIVADFHGNTERLAARLESGNLSIPQWQERMRREIKDLHRTQYMVGRGGRENMSQRDWGRLGADLRWMQYRKLDGFARDIADGKLLPDGTRRPYSEAEIRERSKLYMNASRRQYGRGKEEAALAMETEPLFMWVVGPTESCTDCKENNGQVKTMREWMATGKMPQSNALECKGYNCQCTLVQVEAEAV